MKTTSKFNWNGITGTATTMISDPFALEGDESISVMIKLDRPVDHARSWVFWSDLDSNTITISRGLANTVEPGAEVDVFRVDDFTGLEEGEIPTADQMVLAAASWLEGQSAFDSDLF